MNFNHTHPEGLQTANPHNVRKTHFSETELGRSTGIVCMLFRAREDKGDREGIPPYTPYSIANSSLVIFKTHRSRGGLDNSQSHGADVFRVDDPRSEVRVLHELTQKKMARLKRDFAKAVSAKWKFNKESPFLSCIELTVQQGNP